VRFLPLPECHFGPGVVGGAVPSYGGEERYLPNSTPASVPQPGHRIYGITRVRVSVEVAAPLRYVYDWSTDYRSDDWRYRRKGSRRPRFRVLRPSPNRVLRIRLTPNASADPDIAVDVVRLNPPADWHTDQVDQSDLESVDYHLVRLGPRRTRLELHVTERWLTRDHPTPPELRQRLAAGWARYSAAIEERYRAGLPALG